MKRIDEIVGNDTLPWTVGDEDEHGLVHLIWRRCGEFTHTFAVVSESGMNRRYARLIAAAPDLYRALREAVISFCDECAETNLESCRGKFNVANWREVLANASGEEAK